MMNMEGYTGFRGFEVGTPGCRIKRKRTDQLSCLEPCPRQDDKMFLVEERRDACDKKRMKR